MSKDKTFNYIHFQSIDSTNTWAKTHAAMLDPQKITCITAYEQTAGRGRFRNQWISPPGENIYLTLYFCVPKNSTYIQNLGQMLSVSCCKSLTHFGFAPQIKWPNDILLNGKKVAGILCETSPVNELTGIVLGIGLNVNMEQKTAHKIDQPATSLFLSSNKLWDLKDILQNLLSHFLNDWLCLESEGFQALHTYYNEHLAFKKTTITVKNGDHLVTGLCEGVSTNGSLILTVDSGKQVEITAGIVL